MIPKDIVPETTLPNDNVAPADGKPHNKNEAAKITYIGADGTVVIVVDIPLHGKHCTEESNVLEGHPIDGVNLTEPDTANDGETADPMDEVYLAHN